MILVTFRSRLAEGIDAPEYQARAARMIELVQQAPGFQGLQSWVAPDGERMVTAEFESLDAVAAWRAHPEHQDAQREGRSTYYQDYHLQICEVLRESHFDRSDRSGRSDGDAALG